MRFILFISLLIVLPLEGQSGKNCGKNEACENSDHVRKAPGNVIFITGGWKTETSTEVLDPSGSCSRLTSPLPDRRREHSMSKLGGDLVLCGGSVEGTSCISTRSPDGPWVHHSQLNTDRYRHASVATGDTIHLFGGWPSAELAGQLAAEGWSFDVHVTAETLNDVEEGDRHWKKHQLPNDIGEGACAVQIQNTVYITGGKDALTQTWKWNTDQQWTRLADMDGQRMNHGCGVVTSGGHPMILVAGGQNASYNLKTSAIYDIQENVWRPTGELNQERCYGVMVNVDNDDVDNDDVYMLGGVDVSNEFNTVEKFSAATNEWVATNLTMKESRYWFSAVSVDRTSFC